MLASKPYVIGLTGGIGCGKSEAAQYLKTLGAAHVDADGISRALTAPGGEALGEIRRVFGDAAFGGGAPRTARPRPCNETRGRSLSSPSLRSKGMG